MKIKPISYTRALNIIAIDLDKTGMNGFTASTLLATMFDVTKEKALDDIVKIRRGMSR